MIKIQADYVRYNANTRNKNVGDCVKRALSYAYGVDYDEISRQLNRMKGETGSDVFNDNKVWRRFVYKNGGIMIPDKDYKGITEEEFCEQYPQGVYICLTGKEVGKSSHLVCIFNGDIIDSWNSSNYVVIEAWEIKDVSLETSFIEWEDIKQPILDYIIKYCEQVSEKYKKWFEIWMGEDFRIDNLTRRLAFYIQTKDLPAGCDWLSNHENYKTIVVKLNPRLSEEKNIESLQVQLKGRVYNWVYPLEKDIRDCLDVEDMETHEWYGNAIHDKKYLLKLPEWSRKYIKQFDTPENSYKDYFYVVMEPLPEDNYDEDMRFDSSSLRTLISDMERYRRSVQTGEPYQYN